MVEKQEEQQENTAETTWVEKVVERMMKAGRLSTVKDLAEFIDVTPQALNQSKYRGSIALPLVMLASEKLGVSLDHLIYGHDDDYIWLEPIGGPGKTPVKFSKPWLTGLFATRFLDLRIYRRKDEINIIDVGDTTVIKEGLYALGDLRDPQIRSCKRRLADGRISIEGEDEPLTPEQLETVGVIGRVVWRGMSV